MKCVCMSERERQREGGRGRERGGGREGENKRDCISFNSQIPTVLKLNSCNRDVLVHVYMYMCVWDLSVLCIGP